MSTTKQSPTQWRPASVPARLLPRVQPQQLALVFMLAMEIAIFSLIGENFATWTNFFEVLRLTVELGLLALAMTPVIVTGGIDLSVGSLLGLSAIVMGILWKEAHIPIPRFIHSSGTPITIVWIHAEFPIWLAAFVAVVIGAIGGSLNAFMVTRLRVPPLIVTLGSMWLFRGLAERIAEGTKNFTDFPDSFQFLGQGHVGPIPTQALLFVLAAIGFYVLLHHSTIGRALTAIGYAPEGARHAGIPVARRIALTYLLSGTAAGVAGVLFAAHMNQAKADAGVGYELKVITAVVLGGTSIFGGRGTIIGTLMGLFAIVLVENGLLMSRLPSEIVDSVSALIHHLPNWLGGSLLKSDEQISVFLPAELATILTGILLLSAVAFDVMSRRKRPSAALSSAKQEFEMKNSQLAVLSIVILLAAAIIAGSNFALVHSIQQNASLGTGDAPRARPGKKLTIAMMPKSKGNAYFISCRVGAEAAAKDLGVELLWDGPTDPDPAKQSEVVEAWITRGVDVIAVACENGQGIASVLKKARDRGIKVITWDADTKPEARDFFVTQAMPDDMGHTLIDNAAKVMNNKGEFAIISASRTAENMIAWQNAIEKYRAQLYPEMTMVTLEACDDKQEIAKSKATEILNSYKNVKVIMAICSPAAPGAAEAVKLSNRTDVKVVGVSLPNDNKVYVHAGITDDLVLWKTYDLGYLTVQAAYDLKSGKLKAGDKTFDGGKVGIKDIEGTNIVLGKPFTFTKDNIDQFDF